MADQDAVISFLGDPASYSPASAAVERIDTHGAHVFLGGDKAIKIKRAVRYSYLDFSTLALRRAAIQREYEINRPNAPEIYESVVAITRDARGRLQLGGTGEIVEWALVMRRFEQSALLSRIVSGPGLQPEHVKALADTVFQSHQRAPIVRGVEQAGRMGRVIDDIDRALRGSAPPASSAVLFGHIAKERLDSVADLLSKRAQHGFVRRCHGDLHLDNIVMWKGQPTLFDAIEFDEDLATIDTLYDLAFLLMDLETHGARGTANRLLNRYLWLSGADLDLSGLAALPLFLAIRSGIRAMVAVQRAALPGATEAEAGERQAARYLDAAIDYLHPRPAELIAVGGFSGSGKSTLAAALAPLIVGAPGAVHLRSDLERKSLLGVGETDRLGNAAYSVETNSKVYAIVLAKAQLVLRASHSIVVDAVYSKSEERAAIEDVARRHNVPFHGVWLEAAAENMQRRVAARVGDASDATTDVVRGQLERGAGDIAWNRIDADGTPDATLAAARKLLGA